MDIAIVIRFKINSRALPPFIAAPKIKNGDVKIAGILLIAEALNTSQKEPVPFNNLPIKKTIPTVINIKVIPIMGTKIMKIKNSQTKDISGYASVLNNSADPVRTYPITKSINGYTIVLCSMTYRAVCLGCSHTERKGFKKAPPRLSYHYYNKEDENFGIYCKTIDCTTLLVKKVYQLTMFLRCTYCL